MLKAFLGIRPVRQVLEPLHPHRPTLQTHAEQMDSEAKCIWQGSSFKHTSLSNWCFGRLDAVHLIFLHHKIGFESKVTHHYQGHPLHSDLALFRSSFSTQPTVQRRLWDAHWHISRFPARNRWSTPQRSSHLPDETFKGQSGGRKKYGKF